MNIQYLDKKENIFLNTLTLIKEQGFHGTPMSQIARESQVAVGTIYHYFASKDVLILELYTYCKNKVHQYIFEELDSNLDYKQKFELVFYRFCKFHIENINVFGFMEQFYSSPYFEMQNCFNDEGAYERNHVQDFLQEGIDKKHLKKIDVRTITTAFIGTSISYSKSVLNKWVQFDENNLKDLISIIWQGIKHEDYN